MLWMEKMSAGFVSLNPCKEPQQVNTEMVTFISGLVSEPALVVAGRLPRTVMSSASNASRLTGEIRERDNERIPDLLFQDGLAGPVIRSPLPATLNDERVRMPGPTLPDTTP